jgi:lipopolysaccharide biosynthesis glycosyltransferase
MRVEDRFLEPAVLTGQAVLSETPDVNGQPLLSRVGDIHVVCVCDEHYVVLLGAMLKSMQLNHHTTENLHIWIVEDEISMQSKKQLIHSLVGGAMELHWIRLRDAIPAGFRLPVDKSSYPQNIHTRIFIPHFLPPEVEKVLYMDVDMLVLEDISSLWTTDLQGQPVGAVHDGLSPYFASEGGGGIENYAELGLSGATRIFNSGLMLMHLPAWREGGISEQTLAIIEKYRQYARYPDQYGLNVALANRWQELDGRWNAFVDRKHEDPAILHFIHRKPIYKSYFNDPAYQDLFYNYLQLTDWYDYKPVGEVSRFTKKARNLAQKFFSDQPGSLNGLSWSR